MIKRKLLTSMLALLLFVTPMLASQSKVYSESAAPKKITFEKLWSISEKQMGGHLLSEYGDHIKMFRGPEISVPFVNKEGNIYVVGYDESVHKANNIICLTPNGKVKWKFPIPNKSFVTGLKLWMDGNGYLYFMTWDKQKTGNKYDYTLYSIDTAGKKRWSYVIRDVVYEQRYSFHVLPDGGTVLVSEGTENGNNHIYYLDAKGKVAFHRLIKGNEFMTFEAEQDGRLVFRYSTKGSEKSSTQFLIMDKQGKTIRAIKGFEGAQQTKAYVLPNKKLLVYQKNADEAMAMTVFDAYGKKLWSKRFEAEDFIPNDILVSGNNIYHQALGGKEGMLYRVNGTTGKTEAKFSYHDSSSLSWSYIGSYQNNFQWDEDSITYALVPHDLSRPVDTKVYLQGTGALIVLDPITLKEIGMYKYPREYEEQAKAPFGADPYIADLISSSNGEAFFYIKDKATATRQLMKVKLKYEDQQ